MTAAPSGRRVPILCQFSGKTQFTRVNKLFVAVVKSFSCAGSHISKCSYFIISGTCIRIVPVGLIVLDK